MFATTHGLVVACFVFVGCVFKKSPTFPTTVTENIF